MEILGFGLGPILVTALRLFVPFWIFRWPFWGGILSGFADAVDVILIYFIQSGDFRNYHGTDKILDSYFLVFMAAYSWRRWKGPEQKIALGLFGWRMIGFVAFEITGVRWLLLVFPNIFLWWWVFVAWRDRYKPNWEITNKRAGIALAIMLGPKMLQEMILHIWRLHPVTIITDFFIDVWEAVSGA
jgi:hypothetical protein